MDGTDTGNVISTGKGMERNGNWMFEKGDYIVYGASGVCKIEDITTMNMEGVSKDRLYYVLSPLSQAGGRIFTPVDNQKTLIRGIVNEEQAAKLIEEMSEIETPWIVNDKQREEHYKTCMRSCDCREWIRIIKTLYMRRIERQTQGKKITSTDEKYLKMAEEALYSELSIPLGIPKADFVDYIAKRIEYKGECFL